MTKEWKEEDIGDEVLIEIGGISLFDDIIEIMLPNGRIVIGPSLQLAHIFARWTMVPQMIEVSEATRRAFDIMSGDEND